jgi:hypothetical protein
MSHRPTFISAALIATLAAACSGNDENVPGTTGSGGGASGGTTFAEGGTTTGQSGGLAAGGVITTGGSSAAGGSTGNTSKGGKSSLGGNASGAMAGRASGGSSQSAGTAGKSTLGGASSGGSGPVAGAGGNTMTGGTGGDSSTPVPCATPLGERVTIKEVAVTSKVVTKGSGINSANMPVILATSPDGRSKIAWTDGKSAHVTPLTATGERAAPDIVVDGSEVKGFVAHDDGSALLVRRGDAMVFVRLDEAGTATATLGIVGNESHTTDGSRWIDDWPHQGRLAWSGTQYGAYFGQTGNFGSQGNHQGDHYSLITPDGQLAKGGWDWGCSHSLDERLAHNGTVWAPVCAADTYPPTGFYFNNKTKISDEPTITNVGGTAKLGGLVGAADGFYMTFTSPTGRASSDVGFIKFSNTGAPSGKVFLTDTASVQESWAHLAKYGDRLLVGWQSGSQLMIASIDTAGAIVEPAVATTASIGGQDDFATWPNGDAGWAWGSDMLVRVARVTRCQ